MDAITGYVASHPTILKMMVIFVLIIIAYFIFKQFFRLSLILLLIILAVVGYFYVQNPQKTSERVKKTIDTVTSGTTNVVEKSKSFYKDSKRLINKSAELPGDVNKLMEGSEKKDDKEDKGNRGNK
jgi:hypothetical protein